MHFVLPTVHPLGQVCVTGSKYNFVVQVIMASAIATLGCVENFRGLGLVHMKIRPDFRVDGQDANRYATKMYESSNDDIFRADRRTALLVPMDRESYEFILGCVRTFTEERELAHFG